MTQWPIPADLPSYEQSQQQKNKFTDAKQKYKVRAGFETRTHEGKANIITTELNRIP